MYNIISTASHCTDAASVNVFFPIRGKIESGPSMRERESGKRVTAHKNAKGGQKARRSRSAQGV